MPEEETSPSPRSITDLQPKMRLQGTVKQTHLYGAVLDIGLKQDGVVHISQLSPQRVNRVSDIVKPGDSVTVWVTKVDPETGHIGLTMIEPPRVESRDLAVGQIHTGVVTRLEPYGAFVDIGTKRAGLLHVREMSTDYVRHPSEQVQIGEQVQVRILKLDRQRQRIDLTMMGIEEEVEAEEDVEEEEPAATAMEIALELARTQPQKPDRRHGHDKRQHADLSEQEDILARTLRQHSKQQ
ncbi:MAG: S1 RNA-binding domain-containing protein [Chloroflexota bacterium]|nr:S1 RNA-binding domain-containing protein [Chloroflexota bacterium]